MGLFDSYFDPQTYQGSGGMIDRLLAQLSTQSQYQPAQGFGGNPMQANASVQNAPIAVGNYQMPRIGSGFDMQPSDKADYDQAALPQNAQPTQGQLPQPALPPQLQAQGDSFGDHLSAGLNSFAGNAHNGLVGAILGGVNGLVTGQRNDPTGLAQQNMRTQYQALLAAGVPQPKALLAVISPEFAKTIIPTELGADKYAFTTLSDGTVVRQNARTGEVAQAYQGGTKPKFVQMKDGLGGDHPAFVNETNQTINGQPIAEYNKQQGSNSGGLGNMDLQGDAYLASMPKSEATIVKGMAEGTVQPPSSFAMGKQLWVNRIAAAKNYDPSFDMTNWAGRIAGVRDFSAGKSSEMVRAANQTLHHTGALLDSIDALNNGSYPLINKIGNAANEATGGGAPTAFRINAHAVAEEMSKVFKGANLSDSEIKSWESNLSENMSPEQQRAAVGKLKDLLQGSLQALDEKRVASIGPMAAEKAGPIIKPEGQAVLQRVDQWLSKGRQGSAPGQTKTGVSWSIVQ